MARIKSGTSDHPVASTEERITRRLDAIISLLVERQPAEDNLRKVEDQTIRLARVGLRPVEIAAITGRASNNVTKNIAQARKDGRLTKSAKPR